MRYSHRLRNRRMPLIFAGCFLALIVMLVILAPRDSAQTLALMIPVCGAIVGVVAAVTTLTVQVDDTDLVLQLGFGFLRRRVPLAEIETVDVADMPGFRFTTDRDDDRRYINYVVLAGPMLVLTMKNSASIRFSTDEPEHVKAALKPMPA